METKALSDFITNHSVFQPTIDGFWYYLNNWKLDDQHDYESAWENIDLESIKVVVKKVSLTINYRYDVAIEYVQAYASISNEDEEVAVYHPLFSLEGEDYDDVLSFTVFE
ncbi:hypothetical protein D3C73_1041140 [compost metagenome]